MFFSLFSLCHFFQLDKTVSYDARPIIGRNRRYTDGRPEFLQYVIKNEIAVPIFFYSFLKTISRGNILADILVTKDQRRYTTYLSPT